MSSFTKLDSGIVNSTIWVQPHDVLRVWIAMLALASSEGVVRTAAPALAHTCMIPLDRMREILLILESPDEDSRSDAEGGRRIMKIEGGWFLVNYAEYRKKISAEEKREADRQRIAAKRAAVFAESHDVATGGGESLQCESVADVAQEEGEEEGEGEQSRRRVRAVTIDLPEWLPPEAWLSWDAQRKAMSPKGWTPLAKERALATLHQLHTDGHDVVQVIATSIERGWTGLFAPKATGNTSAQSKHGGFNKRAYGEGGAL